jgi:hypothetical protein
VTLRLRVGGITLAVRARRAMPALALEGRLLPFAARRGADITLELEERRVPAPLPATRLFDSGGLWRAYRHGRRILYTFRPPRGGAEPARGVLVDRRRRRGRLFLAPGFEDVPGFALSYPLDELLLQHHAAHARAFVVHACGIEQDGRLALFCGESGAGKTTTARLWRRRRLRSRVLSDDRILVRSGPGLARGWGTPWHGSGRFASPRGARLGAVFFLERGARSEAVALSRAEATARLLARSFPPPWEASGVSRVLRSCDRVAARVPAFLLRFRPDATAVVAAEGALRRRR